jgi:hypothetical protein
VRLTDELQRAEKQVQRSRDIIREALRFCDETEAHRCIPAAQYDEEGELDNEVIFCARWARCSAGQCCCLPWPLLAAWVSVCAARSCVGGAVAAAEVSLGLWEV